MKCVKLSAEAVDAHRFCVQEPQKLKDWLEVLADDYVALRTQSTVPLPEKLDLSGIGIVDTEGIKKRLTRALVPPSDVEKRKQFSVTRSDLSEVAAYRILEEEYGTTIGTKPVRDRERADMTARGIDVVGVEKETKLAVVVVETKFSDEDAQPPQCVDRAHDGLRKQHIGHLQNLNKTIDKLYDCARKARDTQVQGAFLAAAMYLESSRWDKVDLVSCCIMLRPKARHSAKDFGTFRASPTDFSPAAVRFVIIVLPDDMANILAAWSDAVERRRDAA